MGRLDREYARTARGPRAVQFGLLTAGLTGIGHVLAGGAVSMIVVFVALGFAAWHRLSLGGSRLSWPRLVGVAGLAQLSSHFVLWVGGHDHAPQGGLTQALPGGSMLAVHATLALVMAATVRRSEARLLARLWLDAVLTRLQWMLDLPSVVAFPATPPAPIRVRVPSRILDHTIGRRGPPVGAFGDLISTLR